MWEAEFYLDGKRLESGAHEGNIKNQCDTVDAVPSLGTASTRKGIPLYQSN